MDKFPKNKGYQCNGVVAAYLMETCKIPLLSREKSVFFFSKTKALDDALENMPVFYRIAGCFR
jgi:hypothetical protein